MTNDAGSAHMEGFVLGKPALVCRWRLAGAELPLENRHLRALGQRTVAGRAIPTPLVAWAKQHIEWTLSEGAHEHPDGVLMLIVDESGRAAMTVGPYEGLRAKTTRSLALRARSGASEASLTGVSPETLWAVSGDRLVWAARPGEVPSGAASLMVDLARTVGFPVTRREGLIDEVLAGFGAFDEVFLVSDEHGFVPANNAGGPRSDKFAEGYAKLLDSRRERAGLRG